MRASELRDGILSALMSGPASSSALQSMIKGAEDLHDEIWGGCLRGMIKDGLIAKVLGNYRLNGQQKVPDPALVSAPNSKPPEDSKRMRIERSASGLREALFDAIDGLRAGSLDVKQANAIAAAAGTILKSIDTQVAFERLRMEKGPEALPQMQLVNDKTK